jgi:hypothetical protein
VDPRIVKFFRADRWMASEEYNTANNVVKIRRAPCAQRRGCKRIASQRALRYSAPAARCARRSVSLCNESTCRTAVPHPDGGLDALGHRKMKCAALVLARAASSSLLRRPRTLDG